MCGFLWSAIVISPVLALWLDRSDSDVPGLIGLLFLPLVMFFDPLLCFCGLWWTWRASRNAWALSDAALRYSPAWAVIWQFVPILHLWKGYSALREIFVVSNPDPDGDCPPRILPVFWAFWIAFLVIGPLASKLGNYPLGESIELATELGTYGTASAMVMHLSRWQSEKHVAVISRPD